MFVANLLLALAWALINGNLRLSNLVIGFALSYGAIWLMHRGGVIDAGVYLSQLRDAVKFTVFMVWELIVSNLRVAYDVITPTHYMRPGIIAVPIDAETDAEILLLSTFMTLTPGSLSLDVSHDRKVLYIHAMYVDDPDAIRKAIKEGMERRLLEVLR